MVRLINSVWFAGLVVWVLLLSACRSPTSNQRCPPLPATFKESDLIGTWIADYGRGDTDILELRDDGTYKQTYSNPLTGFRFESDWRKWHVEHRASGYLRLHMEGMRQCSDISSLCRNASGGNGDLIPIDYCEGAGARSEDEVILIATGVSENNVPFAPRGVWLRQMRLAGSDWTYKFELQR